MSFTGTLDKCKACDKTVYVIDMVSADGVPYHKNCFKCSQCNGRLAIGRFSSLDGVLFCMPHFEQNFKKNGNYGPNKSATTKPDLAKVPSKLSAMFTGTQDKCATCKKTVYPLEKIVVEGEFYHKSCFRCAKGGCFLNSSNYAALDGNLYCKPHFNQLFKEKGSYNHLTKSINDQKNDGMAHDGDKPAPTPESEVKQEDEDKPAPTPESEVKQEEEADVVPEQ